MGENSVELFAERVENRAMCAMAQAESLRYKLLGGLVVRRACYGVLRFVMENGAKGCEVRVSGKLRAQRAKVMKFTDGYLISTGQPKKTYIGVDAQRADAPGSPRSPGEDHDGARPGGAAGTQGTYARHDHHPRAEGGPCPDHRVRVATDFRLRAE